MADKAVELSAVKAEVEGEAYKPQQTERTLYMAERAAYKVCFAGLSTQDLAITCGLLLTLYGIVIGLFALFTAAVQDTKFVKSNDGVLWFWFSLGLSYFVLVFGLIASTEQTGYGGKKEEE
jgi:hypothetical protein